MKTLILSSMLICFGFITNAQKVTELEETTVVVSPLVLEKTDNPDLYRYRVNEGYAHEFIVDPIGFMTEYFDIYTFMDQVKDKKYDSYHVRFSTDKGSLEADYNKKGQLKKTTQSFRDIYLPQAVRNELYRQTKGWSMVGNSYKANGKGSSIEKELYRIKVKNGEKSKTVKIDPMKLEKDLVAGI